MSKETTQSMHGTILCCASAADDDDDLIVRNKKIDICTCLMLDLGSFCEGPVMKELPQFTEPIWHRVPPDVPLAEKMLRCGKCGCVVYPFIHFSFKLEQQQRIIIIINNDNVAV
jgi:hypothetical protein